MSDDDFRPGRTMGYGQFRATNKTKNQRPCRQCGRTMTSTTYRTCTPCHLERVLERDLDREFGGDASLSQGPCDDVVTRQPAPVEDTH